MSIRQNKFFLLLQSKFVLLHATTHDINKILSSLNFEKDTGLDGISVKLVKLTANLIDNYLANITNKDINLKSYSENVKPCKLWTYFLKRQEKTEVKNYRPVSLLNIFSKPYEKFMHGKFTPFVNYFPSNLIDKSSRIDKTNRKLEEIFRPTQLCQNNPYGSH